MLTSTNPIPKACLSKQPCFVKHRKVNLIFYKKGYHSLFNLGMSYFNYNRNNFSLFQIIRYHLYCKF